MIKQKVKFINLNTIIYLLLIVATVWVVYLIVYGHGGIVQRNKILNEITSLKKEIKVLENQKDRLNWEIKNLTSNKKYLAGLAHEDGYKGKNEIIFKFLKKQKFENSDKSR